MIIQKQEEFDVVGLSERVSNDEPSSIAALWSQFYNSGLRERLPSVVGSNIYAVYHDYKGDQSAPYVMTIGYRVPAGAACPADLSRVSIPSQDYAVFEAVGAQPQALISQWAAIWKSDLDRAYVADFDSYDAGNKERVTVNVGVKSR